MPSVLIGYGHPGLGDAVLLAPLIHALSRANIDLPVGVLMLRNAARIWEHLDLPVEVHEIEDMPCPFPRRYDWGVDLSLRPDMDMRKMLRASGVGSLIGFLAAGESREDAGLAFGVVDRRYDGQRHFMASSIDVLGHFGVDSIEPEVPWRLAPDLRARALELWNGDGPKIAVCPSASVRQKRWPARRWSMMAERLHAQFGGRLLFLGGPSEHRLLRALTARTPHAKFAAPHGIGLLAALVEQADLVLGNDTGPLQIALSMGRAAVVTHTNTRPNVWGPYRPTRRVHSIDVGRDRRHVGDEAAVERIAHLARDLLDG